MIGNNPIIPNYYYDEKQTEKLSKINPNKC